MNSRHYFVVLFIFSLALFAACGEIAKKVINEEEDCKSCLEKTWEFGTQYGNIRLKTTPKGNYLKYLCLGNNSLVFSCGRDSIEFILDTLECKFLNRPYFVDFEDEDLIAISQGCGTYCWQNIFVLLNLKQPPIVVQSWFLDTADWRFVSIEEKGNEVFFRINYLTDTSLFWTVKSNYTRHSGSGFASMHINEVFLKGDTVYYSIDSNGKVLRDSVFRE